MYWSQNEHGVYMAQVRNKLYKIFPVGGEWVLTVDDRSTARGTLDQCVSLARIIALGRKPWPLSSVRVA